MPEFDLFHDQEEAAGYCFLAPADAILEQLEVRAGGQWPTKSTSVPAAPLRIC